LGGPTAAAALVQLAGNADRPVAKYALLAADNVFCAASTCGCEGPAIARTPMFATSASVPIQYQPGVRVWLIASSLTPVALASMVPAVNSSAPGWS
jgi:hypothetical protein